MDQNWTTRGHRDDLGRSDFIVAIAAAGAAAFIEGHGPFSWWNTMVGVALLFVLLAFAETPGRSWWRRLAYGTVFGFFALQCLGVVLQEIPHRWFTSESIDFETGGAYFGVWIILSIIAAVLSPSMLKHNEPRPPANAGYHRGSG